MFSNYAKPISFSGSVKPDVTITLKDIFLQQVLNYGIWYAKAEANLAQNFRTGCAGHLIYFFQARIVFFLWRRTSWMNGRFLLPLGLLRVLKKKEGCRMEWASEQRRPAAHAWIEGLQWRQDSSPADFEGEGKNFLRTRAEKAKSRICCHSASYSYLQNTFDLKRVFISLCRKFIVCFCLPFFLKLGV